MSAPKPLSDRQLIRKLERGQIRLAKVVVDLRLAVEYLKGKDSRRDEEYWI